MNARSSILRRTGSAAIATALAFTLAPFPSAAIAAGNPLSRAATKQPALAQVHAVSGKNLLVQVGDAFRLSHDDGKTWTKAKLPSTEYLETRGLSDGKLIFTNESTGTLGIFSLAANSVQNTTVSSDDATDVNATEVLTKGDAGLTVSPLTGAGTPRVVTFAEPQDADDVGYFLAPNSSVFADVSLDGGDRALYLIDAANRASNLVPFGSLEDWDLQGTTLWYTKPKASGRTTVCRVDLTTKASSCRALALPGLTSSFSLYLRPGDTGTMLEVSDQYAPQHKLFWFPASNGVVRPAKAVSLRDGWDFAVTYRQENGQPVVAGVNRATSYLQRVNSSGALGAKRILKLATQPIEAVGLALTPTTLLGVDVRRTPKSGAFDYTETSWKRSVGSSIGSENKLGAVAARSSVVASAGRWATVTTKGVRLYDGGKATQTRSRAGADLSRMSGPYLLDDEGWLRGATGTWKRYGSSVLDVFGGLMLSEVDSGDGSTTLRVKDVTPTAAPSITFTLAEKEVSSGKMWGDWVAASYNRSPSGDWDPATLVYNFRTKAVSKKCAGEVIELGDKVVVSQDDNGYLVCNFLTGATSRLPGATGEIAVDGARVAFYAGGMVQIITVAGAGTSAPRLLGIVAPARVGSSWKPQIDLSKPVTKGSLLIKDAAGRTVRSLAVKASPTGSIRGISWNGKDTSGKKVAKGTYTFWLTSLASDGSGPVATVAGSAGALGKVVIR